MYTGKDTHWVFFNLSPLEHQLRYRASVSHISRIEGTIKREYMKADCSILSALGSIYWRTCIAYLTPLMPHDASKKEAKHSKTRKDLMKQQEALPLCLDADLRLNKMQVPSWFLVIVLCRHGLAGDTKTSK
jgi:hypothetical protein